MKREAIIGAALALSLALVRCVTSGNLPQTTPRPDATPDAQWIPAVVPAGWDSGAGGR